MKLYEQRLPFSRGSNVTASRAFETIYQNTSGYPLMVVVSVFNGAGETTLKAEDATPPTIALCQTSGALWSVNYGIVLPGYYYRLHESIAGGSLGLWIEYF